MNAINNTISLRLTGSTRRRWEIAPDAERRAPATAAVLTSAVIGFFDRAESYWHGFLEGADRTRALSVLGWTESDVKSARALAASRA